MTDLSRPAAIALVAQWVVPVLLLVAAVLRGPSVAVAAALVVALAAAWCWSRAIRVLLRAAMRGAADRLAVAAVLVAQLGQLAVLAWGLPGADGTTVVLYAGVSPLLLVSLAALAAALTSGPREAEGTPVDAARS